VLQGSEEVFVDVLLFLAGLMLEALALDDGVVQFRVAGRDFLAVDDEFIHVHGRGSFALWRASGTSSAGQWVTKRG